MCSDDKLMIFAKISAFIIYMVIERFLGKTDKTKSGSMLDLITNIILRRKL